MSLSEVGDILADHIPIPFYLYVPLQALARVLKDCIVGNPEHKNTDFPRPVPIVGGTPFRSYGRYIYHPQSRNMHRMDGPVCTALGHM